MAEHDPPPLDAASAEYVPPSGRRLALLAAVFILLPLLGIVGYFVYSAWEKEEKVLLQDGFYFVNASLTCQMRLGGPLEIVGSTSRTKVPPATTQLEYQVRGPQGWAQVTTVLVDLGYDEPVLSAVFVTFDDGTQIDVKREFMGLDSTTVDPGIVVPQPSITAETEAAPPADE